MEELDDRDFDQIFKNKIKDGYLDFEEEAWIKMERKLRKRNRFVFLRNAGVILLFLSLGLAAYLLSGDNRSAKEEILVKNVERFENEPKDIKQEDKLSIRDLSKSRSSPSSSAKPLKMAYQTPATSAANLLRPIEKGDSAVKGNQNLPIAQNNKFESFAEVEKRSQTETIIEKAINFPKRKRSIILSINAGPDFNSTEKTIGGKSGVALGIGISMPIGTKLSFQTGVSYGSKNYKAEGYDYAFNNPNTVNIIAGIDASCKVLEIPLRATYNLTENGKGGLDVNAGLSSYMMLKENYRFIYTAASGRNDRFLEERNANQHYLSVIDLSATYHIKLKNKNFAFGIEPYLKIPLGGIGEGSVPLKSSGISLKLNYELNRKN
ncbi:MAG: hypothetical protein ACQUHE_06800 [Bacteroidia bacterium]